MGKQKSKRAKADKYRDYLTRFSAPTTSAEGGLIYLKQNPGQQHFYITKDKRRQKYEESNIYSRHD